MEFPYINIKTTNVELTPGIEAYLEKRLAPLGKLLPKGETSLVCDVELKKTTEHHQTGRIYGAEINLQVGGTLFRAEAIEERLEEAIDRAKEQLKKELRRANSKRQSLLRRGGAKLKEMLRFGS